MRHPVVQGDYSERTRLRVQLEDQDGFPNLVGEHVFALVGNTIGTAGNFVRLLDEDPEAAEAWVTLDFEHPELETPGVFRVAFRVVFNPGTPEENQATYPADAAEYISLVVSKPPVP